MVLHISGCFRYPAIAIDGGLTEAPLYRDGIKSIRDNIGRVCVEYFGVNLFITLLIR